MARLRLIFMGTPDIAVPALAALIDAGHEIARVYTQPPRPAGRGHRLRRSPVHDFAESKGLEVHHPESLAAPEIQAEFAGLDADAAVVIAYGLILPAAVLGAPRLGCLNIHMSLLPRWRGAAPIHRAIEAGDPETGVSIMQMDEGLDTGPVLAVGTLPISPETTAGTLHDELAVLGAGMIVDVLKGLDAGSVKSMPQDASGATYAKKITRDQGRLDWRLDAAALARLVRAFHPSPGTSFIHGDIIIRVMSAVAVDWHGDQAPGTVLDGALTIACASGALRLQRLQRPGKAAADAEAFLRGYDLPVGTLLS
jgi:methionyl-tRNA formyltransferase